MPAVKTGMTPPPMPGMPAPMQPMGGVPPMQNPFAPMPPMPLAGMPPPPMPPMAQGQMSQGQGQQMMGSTAGRRRRFGDALEGMLGRNQGIGAVPQQPRPPMAMPQMMPQQRMVAPGTPMMRTPSPRPMAMGGEVDIFGYEDGGPVVQGYKPGGVVIQKNTDGTVSILHSGGGIQTTSGSNALQAMQAAYPGATVVDSGTTSGALASAQQAVRDARRAEVIAQTAAGQTYGDADLGYDPNNVSAYISSDAAKARFNPFGDEDSAQLSDWYDSAINMGESALSRYLSPEEVAGMTDKQKLAAGELFTQGGGAKEYNYLSAEDIDFIQNKANEWGGAVADPTRQAISFGAGSGEYGKSDDSGASSTSSVSSSASSGVSYTNPAVSYEASSVDSGEVNPVDYSQFTGNIGRFAGTPESSALYGPKINIPTSVSQYVQNPVTGQITTTAGPIMTAVSPIGAINLPARPAELDIFDYLGDPTYGSLLDKQVEGMRDGGAVPRQTMIGDQPHMLAYINPQEADLLKDLGGSGEPGPGGIPAYKMGDLGVGMSASGNTYGGGDAAVSGGFSGGRSGHATDDDDSPSKSSTGPSGYTSLDAMVAASIAAQDRDSERGSVNTSAKDADLGVGGSDKSVTASDLASGTGTTTYATDDGGSVTVATGSTIDNALSGGSSVMDVISPPSVSTPPAPTYTDRRGNTYSSQAAADAADRAFASQLASYSFDDDENYTPTADEMAAQLAAQGQTNVTQDPMSVNDQVAALMDRYDQFTPDQYDIESIFGDNYSATEALANMEMAGLLSETELAQGTGGLRDASVDLSKGLGTKTGKVVSSQPITQEEKDRRNAIAQSILSKVEEQVEPTGIEAAFYDVVSGLGLGLGKPFADALRDQSRENRQAIVDQHVNALASGATPVTDEDGNYIGYDISTMDDFADKMLSSDDIMAFMPPSHGTYSNPSYKEDADDDGIIDSDRFDQVYSAQLTAANTDPYGMSTEQGFITSDGREFFVDAGGNVVEVTDGIVPFEPGGGKDVAAALGVTETTTGGDDDTTTTDDTGHIDGVCNNPDYVYNPETDKCEPKAEETDGDLGSPITTAITPRSFDEVLRSVVVPAPDIPSISTNIRPMQAGGMVGLNRAADNFIKALAG